MGEVVTFPATDKHPLVHVVSWGGYERPYRGHVVVDGKVALYGPACSTQRRSYLAALRAWARKRAKEGS